jgi:hypothetical protein
MDMTPRSQGEAKSGPAGEMAALAFRATDIVTVETRTLASAIRLKVNGEGSSKQPGSVDLNVWNHFPPVEDIRTEGRRFDHDGTPAGGGDQTRRRHGGLSGIVDCTKVV